MIRNASKNKNINPKVNGLLKDGLKLREITVLNVIRKPARRHYARRETREHKEHNIYCFNNDY